MRAVLDTNVLVSALLIPEGNERRILEAWQRGRFDLVVAPPLLQELARVLAYPKLRRRRWLSDADIVALVETLVDGAVMVAGARGVRASRDPDDNMFLAAAIEAEATYVVSGDR